MLKPRVGEIVSTGSPLNLMTRFSQKHSPLDWERAPGVDLQRVASELEMLIQGRGFFRMVVLPLAYEHTARQIAARTCEVNPGFLPALSRPSMRRRTSLICRLHAPHEGKGKSSSCKKLEDLLFLLHLPHSVGLHYTFQTGKPLAQARNGSRQTVLRIFIRPMAAKRLRYQLQREWSFQCC